MADLALRPHDGKRLVGDSGASRPLRLKLSRHRYLGRVGLIQIQAPLLTSLSDQRGRDRVGPGQGLFALDWIE